MKKAEFILSWLLVLMGMLHLAAGIGFVLKQFGDEAVWFTAGSLGPILTGLLSVHCSKYSTAPRVLSYITLFGALGFLAVVIGIARAENIWTEFQIPTFIFLTVAVSIFRIRSLLTR